MERLCGGEWCDNVIDEEMNGMIYNRRRKKLLLLALEGVKKRVASYREN
jgi:hypothetical protein